MPKCKRRFRVGLCAALVASGAFAAAAAAATIEGDDGPNRLIGTQSADSINALGGNDRVRALGGDDSVLGGEGNDLVRAGLGNDNVNGERRVRPDLRRRRQRRAAGLGGPGPAVGRLRRRHADRRRRRRPATGSAPTGCGAVPAPTRCAAVTGATCCAAAPTTTRDLGQAGDDLMLGGPGDDTAGRRRRATTGSSPTSAATPPRAAPGNDVLWALIRLDVAGPGDLEGDIVRGGDGDDRIRVRDGEQDIVNCGPGFDVARLDMVDVIEGASTTVPNGDCERVLARRAATGRGRARSGQSPQEPPKRAFRIRRVSNRSCTSGSAPSSSSSSC